MPPSEDLSILLLGKPESAFLLNPHPAEITWRLTGEERAYEHFSIPFVLSTTRLYAKIRNYKLHLLAPGELIQREVEKYEQGTVLEAIHNCLAPGMWRRGSSGRVSWRDAGRASG